MNARLPAVEPVEGSGSLEGGVHRVVVTARVVELHLLGRVSDPSGAETPGRPVDRGPRAIDGEAVLAHRQAVARNRLGTPPVALAEAVPAMPRRMAETSAATRLRLLLDILSLRSSSRIPCVVHGPTIKTLISPSKSKRYTVQNPIGKGVKCIPSTYMPAFYQFEHDILENYMRNAGLENIDIFI